MSEVDYEIRARIVATDASTAGATAAERGIDRVFARTNALSGALSRLFALAGGAFGASRLAQGFIGINTEIQDATNGLATLYNALTGTDIGKSFRVAQQDVDRLRQQAAQGVGELQDYLFGYQRILGPGLGAGASTDAIMRLNQLALSAAGAMGRELQLGPMDVQQALTAGSTDRTTPIVTAALSALGMTNEAFNKLTVVDRMKALEEAFSTFGPGVELMGRGWNAQMATFTDGLKNAARTVSTPLFDAWTDQLRGANRWLAENQDRIEDIAEVWGVRLVRLWDTLIDRAGTYAALVAAAYLAPSAGGMVGGMLAGVGRAGAFLGTAGRAGMLAGSVSGALAVGGAVPGLAGIGAAGGGILGAIVAPLQALAGAAVPLLPAVAGIAVAMAGIALAFEGLRTSATSNSPAFQEFRASIERAGIALSGLMYRLEPLAGLFDRLALIVGDSLYNAMSSTLDLVAYIADRVALALAFLDGGIGEAKKEYDLQWWRSHRTGLGADALAEAIGIPARPEGTEGLNVKGNGDTTIINGPVTLSVKAEINDDPNRTLIAVGRAFDQIRTAAVQGRRIPGLAGA